MLIRSVDNSPFATGATTYNDAPDLTLSTQIVLQVEIGGTLTEAVVDTDSQYVICTPDLAELIGFNPDAAFYRDRVRIKDIVVKGSVHPVLVQFFADDGKGESLQVQAFAFVVDEDAPLFTDELLSSSIGFTGCLESVCFAIDGNQRLFYFG